MVGVCIKYFHKNYGGMLQAYATVKMLEAHGLDYELIRYKKTYTPLRVVRFIPRLLNRILLNDKYEALLKKIGKVMHPGFSKDDDTRNKAFQRFVREHFVKLSPLFIGHDALRNGAKRYSAIITGSDQLWSPAGLPTNYYNLAFVPDETRKISYASSFGVNQIPWYQRKRTARYINRLDYISMRENRGVELVEALTGRLPPIVLDPVFMFNATAWEKLIPVKTESEPLYIFAYFLGNTPEYRNIVQEAAKKLGCKIITLRHLDQYIKGDESFGDEAPYNVDPANFLNLLRGAAYVCTDSFHGAALSIIHHKKFVVFNRYSELSKNSKNSRIDTLCINFGVKERRYHSAKPLCEQLDAPIDYESVDQAYQILKKETDKYLDNALSGIN